MDSVVENSVANRAIHTAIASGVTHSVADGVAEDLVAASVGYSGANTSGKNADAGTCFEAGETRFTAIGDSLVEVLEVPEITPVAGTCDWFLGLAVYRAELLPVTDFGLWAGLKSKSVRQADSDKTRLLVLQKRAGRAPGMNTQQEKIGLLVDSVSAQVVLEAEGSVVSDRATIDSALIAAVVRPAGYSSAGSERLAALVKGLWSAPDDVFIVDLERLFRMESFVQISRRNRVAPA